MSYFNPKIPLKQIQQSRHPWEGRIKDNYTSAYKYGHNSANNPAYPGKKEETPDGSRIKFTVIGVTSVEWPKIWNDLKSQYGHVAYCLRTQVAVLKNDEFLGGSEELKTLVESKYNFNIKPNYEKERIQQFYNFIKSSGRPCAYMHISINGIPIGPLIFMWQNTYLLIDGHLNISLFRNTDCSTQFYVLLKPAPWMAQKFVAFGQLIEGETILSRIENIKTWYESPTGLIKIDKAGVFNMDCQRMPINKNTKEYLERHTEDLFEFARILYEEILDEVFAATNLRYLEQLREELIMDEQLSEVHDSNAYSDTNTSKRNKRTKDEKENLISDSNTSNIASSDYGGTTIVDDSDMDFEMHCEDFSDDKDKEASEISDVGVVKPKKIVYFPLTDVSYPGEVESTFNFQKVAGDTALSHMYRLLKGDYCHETDLETDPGKIQKLGTRETSLFSELKQESEFQPIESVAVSTCILDDDTSMTGHNVSSTLNHPKLIRTKNTETKLDFRNVCDTGDAEPKKVRIDASSLPQEKKQEHYRSGVASLSDVDDTPRPSVLARLYENLAANGDNDAPTLKDYKPYNEEQEQSFILLTNSPIQPKMRGDRFCPPSHAHQTEIADSTLGVLGLQHGMKMTRKISSDYARTIGNIQQKFYQSIRSVEYAKSWPTISIQEYREKNRKYQAEMAAAKNNPALSKETKKGPSSVDSKKVKVETK